jgi:hypothetical protein
MTLTVNNDTKPASQLKCYMSHPPLQVGGGKVVYGGSCSFPAVKDCDIYIGFDRSMQAARRQPWFGKLSALFEVHDMGVPEDKEGYRKMVEWVSEQLDAGKRVHAGCIGGHGRTGMFFAALVAHRKASATPITYVRETYCKKAVESTAQIEYLMKEWGCEKVEPSKGHYDYGANGDWNLKGNGGSKSKSTHSTGTTHKGTNGYSGGLFDFSKTKQQKREDPFDVVCTVAGGARVVGNIWSKSVKID